MEKKDIQLLQKAQSGDEQSRELLITSYTSYIQEIASGYCNRKLVWENDDELSIALLALNEAIDSYDLNSNKKFKNYLRMVVKSRLVDYFRTEKRHHHLPLSNNLEESNTELDEPPDNKIEDEAAWKQYHQQKEFQERVEEMSQFEYVLQEYGLSFHDLEQASPKHQKTRDKLVEVAKLIAEREDLLKYIKKKKKLPLKKLILETGNSKKVLKRGRKYILAVTMIISDERFSYLRSLFSLPNKSSEKAQKVTESGSPLKGDEDNVKN
ncbi:sigma-70 family RNA polymerase sigma factor [Natranaerobius thermophilus]|uniref:RNA polymerase sigma factor SigI n=1 Tax=Natranaerobius thermophilus (strain ATCC BAA-1301 / DSM 18059 / JW/NM-WN-LF) TaxID=457570 RepID=B2A761_NATTJ|nr:sigma-70 family RNA polymerase sigma factor [Natranaerobius thermophilus]ACB84255.1 RNA polymerase, sigma 28 subunit, FliA/WhiG family [Natranaerobius thermophilus JW/NM-WN-LF]